MSTSDLVMHATTILCVRKDQQLVMAGDGQVSMGQTIVKGNAKKVRRIGNGQIVAGFAGATVSPRRPVWIRKPCAFRTASAWVMGWRETLRRLAINSWVTAVPINPAAPVTKTRIRNTPCSGGRGRCGREPAGGCRGRDRARPGEHERAEVDAFLDAFPPLGNHVLACYGEGCGVVCLVFQCAVENLGDEGGLYFAWGGAAQVAVISGHGGFLRDENADVG